MGAIRDARDLLKTAKEVLSGMAGEKEESLRIDCMNDLGIYTSTIQGGNSLAKWVKGLRKNEITFPTEAVYKVKVYELKPTAREIIGAVRHEESGIVVDFNKCLESDMFRLEIQYRMDGDFLRSLVHARSSPEALGEETKYHLSAQLTDPHSLTKGFSEMDIDEFPVTARIYVKENINTVLPGLETFKELRQVEASMLEDYDPRHGFKIAGLQARRGALRKKLLQESPQEALRALMLILRPTKFVSYLRIEQDFRVHRCAWGVEKLEAPGSVFLPENMDVITRTELTLDKPAAKGILYYQAGQFSRDVKDALSKSK